jgi:hypothetical protein
VLHKRFVGRQLGDEGGYEVSRLSEQFFRVDKWSLCRG